jgi:hypothetical protein
MDQAISKNGVPIRLSNERWLHITTGHPETAGLYFEILETIENPLCIYQGNYDELIAIGRIGNIQDKFIVVVYKEIKLSDGFVITAYISNKMQSFKKKKIIWKQR